MSAPTRDYDFPSLNHWALSAISLVLCAAATLWFTRQDDRLLSRLTPRLGADYMPRSLPLQQELEGAVNQAGWDLTRVTLTRASHELTVIIPVDLIFEQRSDRWKTKAPAFFESVAEIHGRVEPDAEMRIESHVDDVPSEDSRWATSPWDLTSTQASLILKTLERAGVPAGKLEAVGLGTSRPLQPNRNSYGWPIPEHMLKNRRVALIFQLNSILARRPAAKTQKMPR